MLINRGKSNEQIFEEYLKGLRERARRANENDSENQEDQETTSTTSVTTSLIPANINLKEYLQTPDLKHLISEYEPDWTKDFNYENSHKQVLQKGLQIPSPRIFIPHFLNVIKAYQGKAKLCDGTGAQVTGKRLEDIYLHLTTNHINNGAWTWLNAKFVPGTGFNNMDLETITGLSNGNLLTKKEPLEPCLMESCYVDFEFNKQGLVIRSSQIQKYNQGENIRYWTPKKNTVAGFVADSYGAGFGCSMGPDVHSGALGVFASLPKAACRDF